MIKVYIILTVFVSAILLTMRLFKKPFIKWALKLRASLKIASLRKAIKQADSNKEKTGRKTMVVFNTANQQYEPIEKKLLKRAANASKRKANRTFTHERVRAVEKNSLYVAK